MRFLYSAIYTILFILALPYFLIVGLWKGKYLSSFRQRLGHLEVSNSGPAIWIHAVSVGEFLAAKPLIRALQKKFPEISIFVSTTTLTGQKLAADFLPGHNFYFPFDWSFAIRRVLQKIQPQLVLVLETEIWPNFLWNVKEKKIPVILVNGRLSDKSFSRYRVFARWLPRFDFCLMQSEEDARRIRQLGVPENGIRVTGNLKFDFHPPVLSAALRKLIVDWKGENLLWIAGSTMSGEERVLLEVFQKVKLAHPNLKFMIAPRHPERFEEVADLIASHRLGFSLRSAQNAAPQPVLLLDSIGELAGCYEFADLVAIGGTWSLHGGHNPIEPAYFGKAIVAGPNFQNFRSVFHEFEKRNAICITTNPQKTISDLIADSAHREALGKAAREIVDENSGATEKTLETIREYIDARHLVEPDQKLSLR